jgi:putative hydrolase of HD superfamily
VFAVYCAPNDPLRRSRAYNSSIDDAFALERNRVSEASSQQDEILRFWSLALRLKRQPRTGWVDRGVDAPESAADHSWGVALLAWLLARDRTDLDRERVLLLGLVHDLPEAVAGDATPFDEHRDAMGKIDPRFFRSAPGYSDTARASKHAAEIAALDDLLGSLPNELADDVRDAWIEYDAGQTPEARYVRQIDKLETLLQAEDYVDTQPELVIDSFRLGARRDLTDASLSSLAEARLRRRK